MPPTIDQAAERGRFFETECELIETLLGKHGQHARNHKGAELLGTVLVAADILDDEPAQSSSPYGAYRSCWKRWKKVDDV